MEGTRTETRAHNDKSPGVGWVQVRMRLCRDDILDCGVSYQLQSFVKKEV